MSNNTLASDDRLSTWQVAEIIQLIDQDLQDHFQDRFEPHQAVYLLDNDGAVTEDDWRQVMSAYPAGADLAYLLIMNELSTTTEIASIPVRTWPWILKAKLDDPDTELEYVFYTHADSAGII